MRTCKGAPDAAFLADTCPMSGERCMAWRCAWWVADGEREGHCAQLDLAAAAREVAAWRERQAKDARR